MQISKRRMKSNEPLMAHVQLNLLHYGWIKEMYGFTLEELFLWYLEDSPDFKYAYWECGRIPRVEVFTNEDWGQNVRARIYLEKPINKNK